MSGRFSLCLSLALLVSAACTEPDGPLASERAGAPGGPHPGSVTGDRELTALGPPNAEAGRSVPRGTAWRLRTDGVDLGTVWLWADVAAWKAADAPVGYGRADLRTRFPAAKAQPVTAYFRHDAAIASGSRAYLRVRCNVGFVAYLEGREIARLRMPEGPIEFDTLATGAGDGDRFYTFDITDAARHVQAWRPRKLAIEVHQPAGPREQLVFDAEVIAWAPRVRQASSGYDIPRGASWAFSTAHVEDGWDATYTDEQPWSLGPAPLGGGAPAVVTEVGDAGITTYFLHRFERHGAVSGATADILYEGGFVAYVNGVEVMRRGLPAGAIDAATPGEAHAATAYERFDWDAVIPLLREGENLLAVELHRPHTNAPIVFDLSLRYDSPWRDVESGTHQWLSDIGFWDPMRGLAVGANGTLRRTTDGGATWRAVSAGTLADLVDLHLLDGGVGWIVGKDGLGRVTRDHGATWAVGFQAPPQDTDDFAINKWLSQVDFVDERHGWIRETFRRTWRTTDGGATWAPQFGTIGAMDFVDRNRGWHVGTVPMGGSSRTAIKRTDDGGLTWTDRWVASATGTVISAIHAVSAETVWAVGATQTWGHGTLPRELKLVTRDGGATWTTVPMSDDDRWLHALTSVGDQRLWAIGRGLIVHSSDAGATWAVQRAPHASGLTAVACVDALRCWAVGRSGALLHTTTGGLAVIEL